MATSTGNIGKVGVLTGGGDCPGLNAVIRAVTKTLIYQHGAAVYGFHDGFAGLVEGRYEELTSDHVSGILTRGGTILGASNKANPFSYFPPHQPVGGHDRPQDLSGRCREVYEQLGLGALVCIGGDGTMAIAGKLIDRLELNIVGVPKTIDNDVPMTEYTFGFFSAVDTAAKAIDRLHSTASSHHRVMVAEVMGRYAGWLALYAGVASGADVILIPEKPYDLEKVVSFVGDRDRRGKRCSIVCVAEGAKPEGGELTVARVVEDSPDPLRLGGVGHKVAHELEDHTGMESRATVLGYVQRGGTPSPMDRVLSTRFGHQAAELIAGARFGNMVALREGRIAEVPIREIAGRDKKVPDDHPLIAAARAVGTCFGD